MANEEVHGWWASALEELKIAEDLLKLGWFAAACFHAQQAAEKGLKALLMACGRLERTHSLSDLLREAARHGLDTEGIKADDVRVLSDQYMAPRYPNFRKMRGVAYEYTEEFGRRCIEVAREIVGRVGKWLAGRGYAAERSSV